MFHFDKTFVKIKSYFLSTISAKIIVELSSFIVSHPQLEIALASASAPHDKTNLVDLLRIRH